MGKDLILIICCLPEFWFAWWEFPLWTWSQPLSGRLLQNQVPGFYGGLEDTIPVINIQNFNLPPRNLVLGSHFKFWSPMVRFGRHTLSFKSQNIMRLQKLLHFFLQELRYYDLRVCIIFYSLLYELLSTYLFYVSTHKIKEYY